MRSYSSAVMPCWASNCGVTVVGSGTTAEDDLVIVDASIVAWESRARTGMRMWKAGCVRVATRSGAAIPGLATQASQSVADKARLMRYLGSGIPSQAGMAELADAADSKSADPCGHGGSTPPPGTQVIYNQ